MRITEAFREYGTELTHPAWTVSAIMENPRQVIVSLWRHNFSLDMTTYTSGTALWKGAGKPIFYRHLALAKEEGLPVRVVIATAGDEAEVRSGNATRSDNDFEPEFSLIGRVVRLDEDAFDLAFVRTGAAPETYVSPRTRATVKYWHVAEAVEALGTPSSTASIEAWLKQHYPEEDHSDLGANLSFLTVNDANRRHYDKGRKNWRSDSGHPRDRLFRQGRYKSTTFEAFRPGVHGHWDLLSNAEGVWNAVALPMSVLAQAEAEAQDQAFDHLPPLDSDHDSRVWTLTAIAQRQGQGAFRAKLLEAYGQTCAITGCTAVSVLEAAHILPYRGEPTHRVDNGLLLRSDIHTLFDLGLLWITDTHQVAIADTLRGTEYEVLGGHVMRLPVQPVHRPNPAHLAKHAQTALEKQR
jgi:hypothetical protein